MENDCTALVPGSGPIEMTETEPFPFLRLPFELRLLCYQYLVPNIIIPSYPVPSRFSTPEIPTEIRADKEICTPGILGVSKQIYHEVINEFYGSGRFELTIVKRGGMTYDFLGHGHFSDDDDLPPCFDLVRHLKVSIKLKGCPDSMLGEQITHIYNHCFFHRRINALETLHMEIESLGFFWLDHLANADKLDITLDRYLGPLKEFRGLKSVTVLLNLETPKFIERRGMTEDVFKSSRDNIMDGLQKCLDELKILLVLPLSPVVPTGKPDPPLPRVSYIK